MAGRDYFTSAMTWIVGIMIFGCVGVLSVIGYSVYTAANMDPALVEMAARTFASKIQQVPLEKTGASCSEYQCTASVPSMGYTVPLVCVPHTSGIQCTERVPEMY